MLFFLLDVIKTLCFFVSQRHYIRVNFYVFVSSIYQECVFNLHTKVNVCRIRLVIALWFLCFTLSRFPVSQKHLLNEARLCHLVATCLNCKCFRSNSASRLSGESPFQGDSDAETLALVTSAQWEFDEESFSDITEEAKGFISSLLVKVPR